MAKTENNELVSPYAFAKIASEKLERKIVPQQVYALVRKGTIPSTVNELGHKQMKVSDGLKHFAKKEEVAA